MTAEERTDALLTRGIPCGRWGQKAFRESIIRVIRDAALEARKTALTEAAAYFRQAVGSCGGEWWKASAVAKHLEELAAKEQG